MDFAFVHPLRVRWSEVDPQAVVFNPNYLVYADITLGEYLRAIGHAPSIEQIAQIGADIFAVHAELSFYESAKYDDELAIGARCSYVGRTSFRMLFAIFRGSELLTEVRTAYCYASLRERKPLPLREELIASVVAHERIPPQRKT
ncbi:MAG TPA: thioesterase family protein [Polyangiales bacterium]|nr:thioesterase family protein [Polyangiales bacterium]